MARYDKYSTRAGGFRAKLKSAITIATAADREKIYHVSIEAGTGLLILGGAVTATCGLLIVKESKAAGDIVDVMTHGEIIDFNFLNDGTTATVLGTPYYADNTTPTTGLTASATTNKRVGTLVADSVPGRNRLIVRVQQ